MREDEKSYTVKEVSEITGFTTRTIRNYIKDGRLVGKKFGRQWRFTEKDISNLSQVVENRSRFKDKQFEFLNYLNEYKNEEAISCYISRHPSTRIENINKVRKEISDSISKLPENIEVKPDFFYHYDYRKKRAEFILFGTNEQIKQMNKIILRHIKTKV